MRARTIQLLSIALFLTLVLWGTWTTIIYLGVPVHASVLLDAAAKESIDTLCEPLSLFCRGAYGLVPFIGYTVTRVPFLVWYAIASAVLFGAYVGWQYLWTTRVRVQLQLTPWKILLLFVGCMWLIFTCMTFMQSGDAPIRRIIEPKKEIYVSAGDEAVATLSRNYQRLKDAGCLTRIGTFSNISEASMIKLHCMQGTFFKRVLTPFVFLLIFVLELLIMGRFGLRQLLRFKIDDLLTETVLSFGVGALLWIAVLWTGAVLHIYTDAFGWALVLLIPLLGFGHTRYWIDRFLTATWEIDKRWYSLGVLLTWFLLSYLALNFINVVRPFPIGWDDLGSYINRPHLLVSYGKFIFSMATFQWEYLTSLGFLLFGFHSVFGATTSLVINWVQGVYAILVIFLFTRTFLGNMRGLLAATLYYVLPLVGHFSFADMKIDNAVFATGALSMLCVFIGLFKREEGQLPHWRWLLLGGLFGGLAFGMKLTAVMVIMATLAIMAGALTHWVAFVGAVLFAMAAFAQKGTLDITVVIERLGYAVPEASAQTVFVWFCAGLGVLLCGVAAYLSRHRLRIAIVSGALFVGGLIIAMSPWLLYNNIARGRVIPGLETGAPNNLSYIIDAFGYEDDPDFSLPPELRVDNSHELCRPSGAEEELGRYWGSRIGWSHYLTLPWRTVMNLDSAGYYVTTMPALLLFPLLLLLPYFWRKQGEWFRWLWLGTLFIVLQWSFLANGVPWYGIGMFLGLVMALEVLVAKAPDLLSRFAALTWIGLALLMCLAMRMWQFETQRNLFEYPLGKISYEALRERTIPHYDDITDIVMERNVSYPDRPLLYRVGTFMPYFIPKNLEIIGVSDHQLDFFNCLYQERDIPLTIARLKALGFNSIVFDTNTATIERDPNGSLHQKVNAFIDFLNSPEAGLQVIINDTTAGVAYLLIP